MNIFTRVPRLVILVMAAALTIAIMGCDGDGDEAPEAATPTGGAAETPGQPTPSPTPTPDEVTCAAGSTDRFLDAQEQVSWAVFCPTFLPAGIEFEDLQVRDLQSEGELPASFEAIFTSSEERASVRLLQGNLGASLPASCPRLAGHLDIPSATTAFGELEGTLYAPLTKPTDAIQNPFSDDVNLGACIVAVSPDGSSIGYVVLTEELDVDTVKLIAAGMRPVSPTPTPEAEEDAATAVQRYELPSPLPDRTGLTSVDCWTSSGSTGRADAFRCRTRESLIYDPCFLDMETMVLACPGDPRFDSTTFYARWGGESGDPDEVRSEGTEAERPWFLVLDAPDSPACRFLTGATMVLPGGARMDFDCGGPCASPEPADGEDLAISCYPGAEPDWSEEEMLSVETQYTVAEAWY